MGLGFLGCSVVKKKKVLLNTGVTGDELGTMDQEDPLEE